MILLFAFGAIAPLANSEKDGNFGSISIGTFCSFNFFLVIAWLIFGKITPIIAQFKTKAAIDVTFFAAPTFLTRLSTLAPLNLSPYFFTSSEKSTPLNLSPKTKGAFSSASFWSLKPAWFLSLRIYYLCQQTTVNGQQTLFTF